MHKKIFVVSFVWAVTPFLMSAAEERAFKDSRGKSGKYTIDRQFSNSRSGALIYFHGSGATPRYASNFSELTKVARRFDLTPVALQAPDNAVTWAEKGPQSGRIDYANDLIKSEVFGKSPLIDIKKTIFVGVSAGATFVSGDFLPKYIEDYGGGAVLLCGGAPPIYPARVGSSVKNFRMFAAIHPTDFLFSQTMAGVDFWRSFGLAIKTIQPAGSGHCGFDLWAAMADGIRFLVGK